MSSNWYDEFIDTTFNIVYSICMNEAKVELSISDIAEILGVTRATIYTWQKEGKLPPGAGLDVIRADIQRKEKEITLIRERLAAMVSERLIISV